MGRAHLHLGHPGRSGRWYFRSLQTALSAGDAEGAINAYMGLGHAFAAEGRWAEAEGHYLDGYAAAGDAYLRLRAQCAINLSMTSREQSRLDEARHWLDESRGMWTEFDAAERSVWRNNEGLLAMAEGRFADARQSFDAALADAPSHHDRAMVLDNIAEICVRHGDLDAAEMHAREAEDYAIAGGSARALADVYIRLGRIMRGRRDLHGVAFFEKAIQLSQENGYTLTEANACTEYALFRNMLGDVDEATGLRERAEHLLARMATPAVPADY
jgi:tetratricopeptide (TPR) repeat protein